MEDKIPPRGRPFPANIEEFMQQEIDEFNQAGGKIIMNAQFQDMLLGVPHIEDLTLEQCIERYGHLLTEDQINKLKTYTNGNKENN